MGFRIKVAPGVRVRVSSRGVRTSVGPRAARVHFISTGVGPVRAYTSLGGGRRSKSSSSRRSVADYEAEIRREQRLERLDNVQRLSHSSSSSRGDPHPSRSVQRSGLDRVDVEEGGEFRLGPMTLPHPAARSTRQPCLGNRGLAVRRQIRRVFR